MSSSFNAILYGAPTKAFIDYSNSAMKNMVSNVTDRVKKKVISTNAFFREKYTSRRALDEIKDVHLRAGQSLGIDTITYMGEPMYSQPVMQRYIMAHPRYYKLAKNNNINGFNETYTLDDRKHPEENSDYLKTMSGWLLPDGGNEYAIEYIDGDKALSTGEQIAIMDTWDMCDALMADDIDPTEGTRK